MKKIIFQSWLLVFGLFLIGCSDGGDIAIDLNGSNTVVKISDLNLATGVGYTLDTPIGELTDLSSGSINVAIGAPKNGERQAFVLRNNNGNPVLVKLRSSFDADVSLGWESTALFFVLNHPDLGLLSFTDDQLKAVMKLVVDSAKFSDVKNSLINEYTNGSTCILKYACSTYATYLASELIDGLNLSGIEK
jgi:hypothetical protein